MELDLNGDTYTLPCTWGICEDCHGEGKADTIGAITGSEWAEDWDQDEREAYLAGRYDSACETCHGTGKVLVPDFTDYPDLLALYEQDQEELAAMAAEQEQERRAGC